MDIEWCLAGGRFSILQARPITALPEDKRFHCKEWPLPGKGPFSHGSIVDFLPDPVSPLFPRADAMVTDVGAPLSPAAIVARELGIPAVVGCGNATMCLHTGDRVRIDGGQGTVEILQTAND